MKRTTIIHTLTPLVCLAGLGASADAAPKKAAAKQEATKKPNVLIIYCDQLAAWTLGCYGGTEIGTPNIDQIAKTGALSTNFYATTPVSTPSRGSFQTGLFPCEHGAPVNDMQIRQDVSTFASVLRDNGYVTGYAGKWHLDGNPKRPGWDIRGKDMGWTDRGSMYAFGHPKTIIDKGDKYPFTSDEVATNPENYSTDYFTNKALDFLNKHKGDTFCYMLSIPDPHVAYVVRAPYNTMFPPNTMIMPKTLTEKPHNDYWLYNESRTPAAGGNKKAKSEYDKIVENLPKDKSQYFGMIKCIDDNVGRILQFMKDNKLMDNTIIVFSADHGDQMGEHARMAKGVPFEGAARIPFIVRYPAKVKEGLINTHVSSCSDFYPTILSLAGVAQKEQVSGRNMADVLSGNPNAQWTDMTFFRSKMWIGVVTKEYKLVYSTNDTNNTGLLIDRVKDPDESDNYFNDPKYASVVKELGKSIADYCVAHKDDNWKWLQKRIQN